MINKKEVIEKSLRGITVEEKYKEILERIFYLQMIDRWTNDDYETMDILHEIKNELEEESKNGK